MNGLTQKTINDELYNVYHSIELDIDNDIESVEPVVYSSCNK